MGRSPLYMPSRRGLIKSAAAAGAGLVLPRPARASVSAADRRFLVIFAAGGWDVSYALWPFFDYDNVDVDSGLAPGKAGNHDFVDIEAYPSVRQFYENWGHQTCALHGFEVPSITHGRCQRLLFTGQSAAQADDFATIIGAHAADNFLLPHTVLSGFAYTHKHGTHVVRAGLGGQLTDLISGANLTSTGFVSALPSDEYSDAVNELLHKRAKALESSAPLGTGATYASEHASVLDTIDGLDTAAFEARMSLTSFAEQVESAVRLLSIGYSRVVSVEHLGADKTTWDEHTYIESTADHFGELYEVLDNLLTTLSTTPGNVGDTMLDEVTVVVLSEMGRHPKLNAYGGKHHWTFTSGLLLGSGVTGDRMIGTYDDDILGQPIDLATGEISESGELISCEHIASTLLALAGVDPGEYFAEGATIEGVLT